MRIGLYLDMRILRSGDAPWARHYGRWIELIEEADRLGTDSIWLSEHHFFEDGYLAHPLVFAAAVATRTKRARIGTAVMFAGVEAGRAARRGSGARRPYQRRSARPRGRCRLPLTRVRGVRRRHQPAATSSSKRACGRSASFGACARSPPAPVQDPLPWWGRVLLSPRGGADGGPSREWPAAAIPRARPLLPRRPGGGRASGLRGTVRAALEHRAGRRPSSRLAADLRAYSRTRGIRTVATWSKGTDRPVPPPVDPSMMRAGRLGDG